MGKIKILVVDDDEGILEVLPLALKSAGYDVNVYSGDFDMLEKKITTENPDVIIMDILMSGVDGRQICRKIKSHEEMKTIPLIMMSALIDAKESALEAGADLFLSKPFSIRELVTVISEFKPQIHTISS